MKHLKSKKTLLFGGILCLAVTALGATIAYNQDSSTIANEFSLGAYEVATSEVFVSPNNWQPGDETEKTLTVRNNSDEDIMVRIKYDGVWRNAADTRNLPSEKDGVELAQIVLQNQSDWELKGDGYYYYKNALAPNSVTSSLFQKVVLNPDANFGADNVCTPTSTGTVCEKPADDYEGAKFHLSTRVETIQPDAEEEQWLSFGVLNKGSIVNAAFNELTMGITSVKSITFVDELPSFILPDVDAFRRLISVEGEPIYAYVDYRNYSDIYIYSEANIIYCNEDCGGLFSRLLMVTSLVLPEKFNTSLATDMSSMFSSSGFTSLTLPNSFNTSNVRNMKWMFSNLSSLTSLTFPESFDTSKVESMQGMFQGIGVSSISFPTCFDVSEVRDMAYMFGRSSLTSLTLPNRFNPINVEDMRRMFSEMRNLTSISFPDTFNTPNARIIDGMFSDTRALASLELPNSFDTSNVETMEDMFRGMRALVSLVLPESFNTSKARHITSMFAEMDSVTNIVLPTTFSTANITDLSHLFHGDRSLVSLTLPSAFVAKSGVSANGIFEDVPASATLNSSADASIKALWPGSLRN